MKNLRFALNLPAVAFLTLTFASVASALPLRTWVSSAGMDGNPCSRSSPCATFQGAHDKTAAGGEINCVDAADYGTVLINKALTIDCAGTLASIFVPMGSFGITVAAGSNDVVTLRNLSLDGGGTSNFGIVYNAAAAVHLENIRVFSFSVDCVHMGLAATSVLLTVDDSTISDCGGAGLLLNNGGGTAAVNINNTRISKTAEGINAINGTRITITNSTIFFNNYGVFQFAGGGSTVTAIGNTFGYSAVAALQSSGNGPDFILAFGNNFVNDVLVFNPNGGQIYTGGDNNNSGSTAGTANGGTLPKI